MKKLSDTSYNERLFSGGVRGFLHGARYRWFTRRLKSMNISHSSLLDLGCFDGKVIDYLTPPPKAYVGLDANWEGGLDIAKSKWIDHPNYKFRLCNSPEEMNIDTEFFDVSVCMETLEHVPPEMVDPYLKEMAKVTNGYIFITVPNEIGIVFICKYIVKSIFGDTQSYTFKELVYETLGMTHKVNRFDHKGFNYKVLAKQVSKHFDLVEVSGHPFTFGPTSLNFGIGIIGKARKTNG